MKYSSILSVLFLLFCGVFHSCDDEVQILPISDCVLAVTFKGTNVCSDDPNAAAVELADSSLLIVSNFFDFADSTTIMIDDNINISYSTVDSTLFNSGALCGVAIVAPITEITCFGEN